MIYIIDDDKQVREGFMILLKSAGFNYSSFENAAEFLSYYKPDDHDLLIMDLQMPSQTGCNLLEILHEKGILLPVIIITAHDDKASRECAKKYGAIAYLRKPVDSEALLDLIRYQFDFKILPNKIISSPTKRSPL